jgi:glutathione S-transferase
VQRSAIVFLEKNTEFEFRHTELDNRPDWFLAISPHKKVPAMTVDDKISLFESNAINEYLDETIEPQLHPADPVERAVNRAWTDYVLTFASIVTTPAYADTEADYNKAVEQIPVPFERGRNGARKAEQRIPSSTASNIRWSMLPMRRLCSAITFSTGSGSSALSRNTRVSRHGWKRCSSAPRHIASRQPSSRRCLRRRNKWVSRFIEPARAAAE